MNSNKTMSLALAVYIAALMFAQSLKADEIGDYIRKTGPFSFTVRHNCKVVTVIDKGDYVVCRRGEKYVWRRVEKCRIADIKEFDVESFLILPHELRKRIQSVVEK